MSATCMTSTQMQAFAPGYFLSPLLPWKTLPCVRLSHLLSDTYYLVWHLLPCVTYYLVWHSLPCLVLGCHTYYQTPTTLCDTYYLVWHLLPCDTCYLVWPTTLCGTYYLVWPTTLPCVKLSHLLSDTYYLVRHLLPCATPITLPCVRLSHLLSDTYYQCDNLLPYTDPPPHEQSPVSVCSKSALDLGPRSCNRCKHKYMMAGGNMICCNSGDLGACPRTWSWGGVWSAKNKRGLEFEESDGRKGRS